MTLLRIINRDFGSSYQTEMLPQRWKETAAPGTSSWSAGSEFCSDGSGFVPLKCPCCQFCSLLYRPSRRMFLIDRRLRYHCPVAPDPLPTWVDSWGRGVTSPHSRILIQSINVAHCRPFSHTGHYLGCHCVCLSFSSKDGSPCNESNVYFLLGMGMISPHVLSLWLMGDNAMQYDNILQ